MSQPKRHEAEQFDLPLNNTSAFPYQYPSTPGYKNKDKDGPSRQAALSMITRAPTLREQCLERIEQVPMTADEVADSLEKPIWSIRPRITELVKLGKVEDSGNRRNNSSGKMATVWRIKND
jgi:predicted HTH transcriptional regulator